MFWRNRSKNSDTLPAISISLEHAKSIVFDYTDHLAEIQDNECDENDLPHSKRLIKHAIVKWIKNEQDAKVVELLKINYLSLAKFISLSDSDKAMLIKWRELIILVKSNQNNFDLLKESNFLPNYRLIQKRYEAEHDILMSEITSLS